MFHYLFHFLFQDMRPHKESLRNLFPEGKPDSDSAPFTRSDLHSGDDFKASIKTILERFHSSHVDVDVRLLLGHHETHKDAVREVFDTLPDWQLNTRIHRILFTVIPRYAVRGALVTAACSGIWFLGYTIVQVCSCNKPKTEVIKILPPQCKRVDK